MRASRRRRFVPSMDHLGARIVLSDVTGTGPDPIIPPPPVESPSTDPVVGDVPITPPGEPILT